DSIFAGAKQRQMRDKLLGRGGIQAQRVHTGSDDIPLLSEEACGLLAEAGSMHRPLCIAVQEPIGVANTRVPARMHRHKRAAWETTVTFLPREHVVYCDHRVGILRSAGLDRDHREWRKESVHRD